MKLLYVVLFIMLSQVCDTQAQTVRTITGAGGVPYVVYQDDSIDGSRLVPQDNPGRSIRVYGDSIGPDHRQESYTIELLDKDTAIRLDATVDDDSE